MFKLKVSGFINHIELYFVGICFLFGFFWGVGIIVKKKFLYFLVLLGGVGGIMVFCFLFNFFFFFFGNIFMSWVFKQNVWVISDIKTFKFLLHFENFGAFLGLFPWSDAMDITLAELRLLINQVVCVSHNTYSCIPGDHCAGLLVRAKLFIACTSYAYFQGKHLVKGSVLFFLMCFT